ncbi:DUF3413 domain-containing protein [Psychromonas sp. RZ22]|uniref:DUF3413 domain-containing protein n=1 Tax=Psychromonas algarum TaxID=2555643 RepID=UPI0010673BB9|nr:DUF3413 domain-containing protein [Psychromonas sp. RZ22]TEW56050.1 DUF3413 domain-containing protein [Psychromonas sp. RZ22]
MVETGHKFYDNVAKKVAWAHWFTFFNIIAVSLISIRYVAYSGLADSALGILYQFVSLIGHFSFLSAVVFGIFLFPLAFLITNNLVYRLTSILIATVGIAFLIVDTQIFRLYGFHLNPLIWQFLQRPEQVEAIYSINLHYISIPIIFALEVFFSLIVWKKVRNLSAKRIGKPITLVLLSAFILSHLLFIWADATQYRPVTLQKSLYPLSYPMTARTFLTKQGLLNEESIQKNKLAQDGTNPNELRYPIEPLAFSASENNPEHNRNILIITVESLRADMLNAKSMPYLQTLSEQGFNFKQHFSGANNSEQGVFSLFYGLPNSYWTTVINNHISPVFIDKVAEDKRPIGLFSGIGFVHPEFLQSSFSQLKATPNVYFSKTQNNNQVVQQWNKWVSEQKNTQPWFSYVYLAQKNSHLFAQNNHKTVSEQSEDLSLYQSQVLTIDNQIKRLVERLKKQKQYKNTIIMITGTNGQSFKKANTSDTLINGSHVPMVLIWPNKVPQEINRMTSHVDIMPTLMQEVFSVDNMPSSYSSGKHLFSNNNRQYVLSGDTNNYIIYETDKITQFSRNGDIDSINWQGDRIEQSENNAQYDITLLIDVLSKLRRFNPK